MARGALGCSISGAGPTMFAWAEEAQADGVRAAMVDAFRAHGIIERRLDHSRSMPAGAPARECDWIDAMTLRSARAARAAPVDAQRGDRAAASRRTAGCTCPTDWPRATARKTSATRATLAGDRRALHRAVRRGRSRSRRELRRHLRGGVRLSRAARAAARARAPRRARAVSRPDGRVQGFRRALPRRRHERVRASPRDPQLHDPRRDVGRHRRRGRRGVSRPAGRRRRPCSIPKGLVSPRQAAAARVLGRQRARVRRARHVRRLPAHGQGGVRGSRSCARARSCRRRTASTSAGCCRRWCTTPRRAWRIWREHGAPADFIVPTGNLGNVTGVRLGARDRAADRRHRARDQREPRGAGVLRRRRLAPARERCRRWPPRWTSAIRATWSACARCFRIGSRSRVSGAAGHRRTDPRDHPAGRRGARLRLGSAWRDGGACLSPRSDGSCGRAVGAARDGAPGQVQRDREPLIGRDIEVPPSLARLLRLPRQEERLAPTLDALRARL